jgi:hypothetical protein
MHPVCVLLLASLCSDAGVAPDAGVPLWAPTLKRGDVEEAATYGLHKWGEGYVYDGSKFEARVGRDGVVTFKDRHGSIAGSVFPFSFIPRAAARQPGASRPSDFSEPGTNRRGPWLPTPRQPPVSDRKIPQEELCPPNSSCYALPMANLVRVSGNFDLTDEIMRMLGQDPYRLEKARFLSATFEFRIKMAIEARKIDMKKALDHLPAHLDELFGDGRYTPRERRRILYELWYEMDRTADGERAAKIILDFIRRRLPCGVADSYTRAELDAFDKAHPEHRFVPGDDCATRSEPQPVP